MTVKVGIICFGTYLDSCIPPYSKLSRRVSSSNNHDLTDAKCWLTC